MLPTYKHTNSPTKDESRQSATVIIVVKMGFKTFYSAVLLDD